MHACAHMHIMEAEAAGVQPPRRPPRRITGKDACPPMSHPTPHHHPRPAGPPDHDHGHGHDHDHDHGHGRRGRWHTLTHLLRPHGHESADKLDAAMESSAEGMRILWVSLTVLGLTAALQAAVVAISGSVALLGDTLHNAADALTALPLAVAFMLGRR